MGWGRSGSRSPTVALLVIQTTRLVTGLQANRKGTRNRPFQGGKDRFYFSMTALEACGLDTCTAPGRGDLRSSGRRGQETRAEQGPTVKRTAGSEDPRPMSWTDGEYGRPAPQRTPTLIARVDR